MTQAGEPYGQRNLSQADEAHDAKRRGCLRRVLDWMPHWAVAILLNIGLTALGRLDLFDLLRYPVSTHLRGALLVHESQVHLVILLTEERGQPPIAPLRDACPP